MDPQELVLTALRASLIYFFLLFVVRILGKRAIGHTSAFDLIVALMLGEVVDEVIYGDVSITKGLLVITVIAIWHLVNAWASYKSNTIDKLTGAEPRVIVQNGKVKEDALAKERINPAEVFAELRMLGVDDISEVKLATLEPSGQISLLKEDWAKPVQKQDVFKEKEEEVKKTIKTSQKDINEKNKKIQNPEDRAKEKDGK